MTKKQKSIVSSGISLKRLLSSIFVFTQNDKKQKTRGWKNIKSQPSCQMSRVSNYSLNTGRSIVEMLGVLAIIGVLSLGSIIGLKYAFTHIRANNLLQDVRVYAATIVHNNYDVDTKEYTPMTGYSFDAEFMPSDFLLAVNAYGVDKDTCKVVYNKASHAYAIKVNDVLKGDCNLDEKNVMSFWFNTQDFSSNLCTKAPLFKCDTTEDKINSNGCLIEKAVKCNPDNKEFCSASGFCEQCQGLQQLKADGSGCECPSNMIISGNSCDCPTGEEWVDGAYLCLPKCDKTGMSGERDENYSCKCLEGTNAETCACPSGSVYTEGSCQRIVCEGGPEIYECYINGEQCGDRCNAMGKNCVGGYCWAEDCPEGTKFAKMPYLVSLPYACQTYEDENIDCYTRGGSSATCLLKSEGKSCMQYDFSNGSPETPTFGICDVNFCKEYSETATFIRIRDFGGCSFDDGLSCYPRINLTNWNCEKNGFLCGSNCSDPLKCENCNNYTCPSGLEYNMETQRCEADNFYCVVKPGAVGQPCYMKEDDTKCGEFFSTGGTTLTPYVGNCTNPGCPEGTVYSYSAKQKRWGCTKEIVENGKTQTIFCSFHGDLTAHCFYGWDSCGRNCNYDGTNCGTVFLPQCANDGICAQNGQDMSYGCECHGSVTTSNGRNYCCPAGHAYVNSGCTMSNCGDQYVGEGGICVDSCPKYISSGVCVEECPSGQTADENKVCT